MTLVGDVKRALFIFKSFGYLILLIQSETRFHSSGFMHVYYYYSYSKRQQYFNNHLYFQDYTLWKLWILQMCFDVTVSTVSLEHIKTDTLKRRSTCNNTRTIEILYFLTQLWNCTCKERVLSLFDETVRFRRVQRAFYPEVILTLILWYLLGVLYQFLLHVCNNKLWAKLERSQILLFCDSLVLYVWC